MRFVLLGLIGVLAYSCTSVTSPKPADAANGSTGFDHDYLLMATAYVQHSSEYRALCYQAYENAGEALRDIMADPPAKPAVVLDLDETVLDNSPYAGWQILNNQPFARDTWQQWTMLAQADTVPGSSAFLHLANQLGVQIFYVSNRRVEEKEATLKNLRNLGLPQVADSTVYLRDTTSSKVYRREAIAKKGYEIVMLIGDNLDDMAGIFERQKTNATRKAVVDSLRHLWGTKYFVLPNPVYGAWDGALIRHSYNLTLEQRDSIRKSKLKSF